ncbi:MAG: hypothetical protein OEV43_07580 [Coriobacteriia bacterium]|nr:hypothetical protein [Coriobacteriia bacterium]
MSASRAGTSGPLRFLGRLVVVLLGVLAGFFGAFNAVFSDIVLSTRGMTEAAVYVWGVYAVTGIAVAVVAPARGWRWVWWIWVPGALMLVLYSIRESQAFAWHAAVALYAWVGAYLGAYLGAALRTRLGRGSSPGRGDG